jgi:O-antigen/teichoic acid export membrane protein
MRLITNRALSAGRLHRSATNMAFNVTGWVASAGINFAATPFLVRWLGPDGYGLQNLVGVVIGYFIFMDLGLDFGGIKYLSEFHARNDTDSENRLLSTNLQIYAVMGLAGMVLILLFAGILAGRVFQVPPEFSSQAVVVFRLAALGFLANMLVAWGGSIAQGLQRYDILNSISMASSIAAVSVGLAVVYLGYGVVGFVLIRIITSYAAVLAYFYAARRLLPRWRLRPGLDREMLRRVGGAAGYGLIFRITGILTTSLDRTLIGAWLGTAAVTLFAVPNLAVTAVGQLVGRPMSFFFPMASELASTDEIDALRSIFIKSSRFLVAISAAAFLPLCAVGDTFLTLWVGPLIAAKSTAVFRLLLVANFLGMFAALPGGLVLGMGNFKRAAVYSVSKVLIISVGCGLLIRPLGVTGAGIAALLGALAGLSYMLYSPKKDLQIGIGRMFRQVYLKPVGLGLILSGAILYLRPLATTWLRMGLLLGAAELLFVAAGYTIDVFGETEKKTVMAIITWARDLLSRPAIPQ